MLGPYIDTLLICSLTGLVIITTGVFNNKMTETKDLNHHVFDFYTVPTNYSDHWMNTDLRKYNANREDKFSMPEFDGTVHVYSGAVESVELTTVPQYPADLANDTLCTLALVRNHGFVENMRIMGAGVPFTGSIKITGSGSPGGQSVTVVEGGPEALSVEGDIYQNGSPLTAWGFQTGLSFWGNWGNYIITIAVFLFALSTMISWSYYGDRAIQYLIGDKAIMPYRYAFCIVLFIGATSKLENIWGFGDVALGLMAIPNLIAILLLSKTLKNMTKEYFSRKQEPYSKKIRLF